ncbi:hypothetical protein EJ02DRAFT_202345 [Clathrospora elynae]|uniref:Secreted protein n=1 Tax=Clathrospora elynae TaxID=706981 RepID=A0A6A5SWP4_9PLEO|nr:hypothetical protein EJ02DRAFT_202345 [Clathrospora elynae]
MLATFLLTGSWRLIHASNHVQSHYLTLCLNISRTQPNIFTKFNETPENRVLALLYPFRDEWLDTGIYLLSSYNPLSNPCYVPSYVTRGSMFRVNNSWRIHARP